MDALEFVKYLKKMCAQYGVERPGKGFCQGCPALTEEDEMCVANFKFSSCDPNKVVEAVEKYAKENPIKTRNNEFLKHYPNAVNCEGVPVICPKMIDVSYNPCNGCSKIDCYDCRKEYWMQVIEGE